MSKDEMITRKEAATHAGVTLRTIARMLADGRLTKYTDGFGRVSIDLEELSELITPVVASHRHRTRH